MTALLEPCYFEPNMLQTRENDISEDSKIFGVTVPGSPLMITPLELHLN